MMDTDAEIVREAIRLFRPGLIEVRILHTQRGTQSGYFDEDDALINAVLPFDGAQNIYVTMNPVNSELLAVRRGQRRTRARPAPRGPPIRAVYVAYALCLTGIAHFDPLRICLEGLPATVGRFRALVDEEVDQCVVLACFVSRNPKDSVPHALLLEELHRVIREALVERAGSRPGSVVYVRSS
jgi:hypothetical protein